MKYLICAFSFAFFLFFDGTAQKVFYPVTNYNTKDYGREFNPSNWSIAHDQNGIIYAANGFKLLEFDGHSWNSFPISKGTWILSLAVDRGGIIYAGSQNEFGFFAPDRVKGLKYVSLSDSLKGRDHEFSNVRYVNTFPEGVAFQSEEKLFIYGNGKITVINPETSFHTSFVVNNTLYVREREIGLMEWKNNRLNKIAGGELFESTGIFLMVPSGHDSREILIGTQEKGFWLFDPSSQNRFRPFSVKDKSMIDDAKITGGILLNNDKIALSTLSGGVIIIDLNGNTASVINKNSGLGDNDVKQVITDRYNNLWMALNKGISTAEYSSPISSYSDKSGLEGLVNTVIRYNDLLYVGTTAGLFSEAKNELTGTIFSPVFNLSVPVRSLAQVGDCLVAGTDAGIYTIQGNSIIKTGSENSFSLYYSQAMKLLFSGGSKGLSVYQCEGSFKKIKLREEVLSDIISIAGKETENSDSCIIWIGTRYDGAIRLIMSRNLHCTFDRYTTADGLLPGSVVPFYIEGEFLFGANGGLFRFISENAVKATLPDSLKNNPEFLKGYFSSYSIAGDTLGKSVSALVDAPGRIWICADNNIGYIDKKNNALISQPFRAIDADKIYTIYQEGNGFCWFGTSDGLARYDINNGKDYSEGFPALIRKVVITRSDSVLFPGRYYLSDTSGLKILSEQPDFLKPQLSYRNNSLRFDFAATFFEHPDKLMFSCRLDGYDATWSAWEHKYYQDYTNLHEGKYVFHVRAGNVYGHQSDEAHYSFVILPPWYRSLLAFILYIVASILLVWLIVRLYSIRLKRENIRLEGIVLERTAEVVRQKDVLEHQNKEIEDSIRYASRIQNAVLPANQDFTGLIPESFVFFKPRDIVSGDFYWISRVEDKLIISAADCTGHGVPGAFMSMLGVAFLNEIVNKDHVVNPDMILKKLREKVIEALQQQGISGEAKDGMDMVVICIDKDKMRLQYAGAYNPLIMIRGQQLSEIHADKMPIAIYDRMKEFTRHEIEIEKGDRFYFFSDGFEDQFGGPDGKKFKSKKFKELLLGISGRSMKEQKEILETTFDEWKGDQKQVDDIVVVGVQV